MSAEDAKRAAAAKALEAIGQDMVVGLGTGSTAGHFIDLLGARCRDGLRVTAIPSSMQTQTRALAAGIDIIEPDETTVIDIAVDGADEIDPNRNLIKGGGGALFREKIIARAARRFVVIADTTKAVRTLGAFPTPLEVEPFGFALTVQVVRQTLHGAGFPSPKLSFRPGTNGLFQSDSGHYVLDCALERIDDIQNLDEKLRAIPGVIETGLFVDLADEVILADPDGTIKKV